jgi:acetyl esterase/lipase
MAGVSLHGISGGLPMSRSVPFALRLGVALILGTLTCALYAGQPDPFPIERDVVYGKAGDVELKLDLAKPQEGHGPFPLVVCIHGGAWRAGSKAGYAGRLKELAKRGYVAASVEYRFCPLYKFPAQVEDVKCAVRFLRAHAKDYSIDPTKVAAMGDSAGGHLSLMLGLMDPADGLEGTGGNPEQSSKVQAVVNYYGPTDFTAAGMWTPVQIALVADFLGTKDATAPVAKQSSPLTYVNQGDPPVLTFQGTLDPLVPVDGAKRLHEALRKAGVKEHLEIIEGGSHGFAGPVQQRTLKMAFEFLDETLKGKPAKVAEGKPAEAKPAEAKTP